MSEYDAVAWQQRVDQANRGQTGDLSTAHRDDLRGNLAEATASLRRELASLKGLLDERYANQTRAVDAAFLAQKTAMEAALAAQDRAVGKAEVANDKRFESVNEFRGQLADQAATFVDRRDMDSRFVTMQAKMEARSSATDARFSEIDRQLSSGSGRHTGVEQYRTDRRLNTSLVVSIGVIILMALGLATTIMLYNGK